MRCPACHSEITVKRFVTADPPVYECYCPRGHVHLLASDRTSKFRLITQDEVNSAWNVKIGKLGRKLAYQAS